MSLLDRRITVLLNRGLDTLLPAIFRDSLFVMMPLMRLVLGSLWREFASFKERASSLSPTEIDEVYQRLASSHLQRKTDLHPACLKLLQDQVLGRTVLDVGCGSAYLVRHLQAALQVEAVGLDIMPPPNNTENGSGGYYVGRAESLPFADNSFDTVVCAHTLEHTVNPIVVIDELRRVARQRMIIIVPRQHPFRYTFDLHLQFFPYPFVLDLMMGAQAGTTRLVGGDLYYAEDLLPFVSSEHDDA